MSWFGLPHWKFTKKKNVPEGIWTKCPGCSKLIYTKKLEENLYVCPECGYYLTLSANKRIEFLFDKGTFREDPWRLRPNDPLEFTGAKPYKEKLEEDQKKTGLDDAVVTGVGKMLGFPARMGVTDSHFIMGSMGSVVGERLTRMIERAIAERLPVIIVSGSGGGARMYEGLYSLLQMSKTCAALSKLRAERLPFISVLTNPTMAGVMASFASVGDVIIAEPKALIGFTGPRVIEQTIKQKLPENFQSSEFLLDHGMIDMIVERKNLKARIAALINYMTE